MEKVRFSFQVAFFLACSRQNMLKIRNHYLEKKIETVLRVDVNLKKLAYSL
jgi:hypothetical protein